MFKIYTFHFVLFFFVISCSNKNEIIVEEIPFPGESPSAEPNLTAFNQDIYLTWINQQDTLNYLYFSKLEKGNWSTPKEITRGTDWFVNWADFPAMQVTGEDGSIFHAHFLKKSSPETFSYNIMVTTSTDGGNNWEMPIQIHGDTIEGEHGFLSFFPMANQHTGAVWLDGRESAGSMDHGGDSGHSTGAMTLRFGEIDQTGKKIREERLDERICDCCQTSAVSLNGNALAVYRNRTEEEIRDIWMVRFDGENWSSPEKFSEDNWEIAGCPVNGPSIDAFGNQVAVAWFTGAGGIMKVKLKISNDEGKTFGSEILVNDGNPTGRVDLALLDDENIAVSWIETSGEVDFLRLKLFDKMGQTRYSYNLTPISSSRKSGFPRIISAGENQLIFAWTDIETNSIRTAAIKLDL